MSHCESNCQFMLCSAGKLFFKAIPTSSSLTAERVSCILLLEDLSGMWWLIPIFFLLWRFRSGRIWARDNKEFRTQPMAIKALKTLPWVTAAWSKRNHTHQMIALSIFIEDCAATRPPCRCPSQGWLGSSFIRVGEAQSINIILLSR